MLHQGTLFLITALIDTAGTVIFLVLWWRNRQIDGLLLLALGMGVLALGIWLQILRPLMPSTIGIISANTAIHAGHGIMLVAVSRIVGRPGPAMTAILVVLAATAGFIYFTIVEPANIAIRVVMNSLVLGIFLLGSAWQLFRASPREGRVVHLALGSMITMAGLFMFARALVTYRRGSTAEMLAPDPIHLTLLLISVVLGFVYVFGFVILISHRQQARLDDAAGPGLDRIDR